MPLRERRRGHGGRTQFDDEDDGPAVAAFKKRVA